MPKGSETLTAARKEEIIAACEQLYRRKSFKEITMKEIAQKTSFTRTSIYNYFQTKEEIFLALLEKEYSLWIAQLRQLRMDHPVLSRADFADALARSLEERKTLLKLMSMNHYDLEENSRLERLVEFKTVYGQALTEVRRCLQQFFPKMDQKEQQFFLFSFFPFMFGIYPYTVVSEKQRKAMQLADVHYVYLTIYEITFAEVKKLLSV